MATKIQGSEQKIGSSQHRSSQLFYIMLLMPLVRETQSLEVKARQQTQISIQLFPEVYYILEFSTLLLYSYCYLSESCHHFQTALRSAQHSFLIFSCLFNRSRSGTEQSDPVTQVTIQRIHMQQTVVSSQMLMRNEKSR